MAFTFQINRDVKFNHNEGLLEKSEKNARRFLRLQINRDVKFNHNEGLLEKSEKNARRFLRQK